MDSRWITRREAIKRGLAWSVGAMLTGELLSACGPSGPPPCEPAWDDPPIGWKPGVLAPVFYGYADYDSTVGAPTRLRVYYPSLDGSPQCAPFLTGPGMFPLVVFLHGQCSEDLHYTKWFRLPAGLARAGYIVAMPDLTPIGNPWDLGNATYGLVQTVITWMRTAWSHSDYVQKAPTLGIIGHSYGALHAGQLALTIPATAYVSLGGAWTEWPTGGGWPIMTLPVPKLLVWGTLDWAAMLPDPTWNNLALPKHRLVFTDGEHWDYVPPSATTCDPVAGDCELIDDLTADFVALFLSKYMPPPMAAYTPVPGVIPDSLVPPPALNLSTEQMFFGAGPNNLMSFGILGNHPDCSATLTWVTPNESDSRSLP